MTNSKEKGKKVVSLDKPKGKIEGEEVEGEDVPW